MRLAKLAESFDYGTSAKSKKSGSVPVLRMGNIQNGEIDWNNLVFTSNRKEIEAYSLTPNTVLFNRTNSPELVGKTAIYRGERPAIFAGYLIRVCPSEMLDPEYLNLCLNAPLAREFCLNVKTDGVSQSNINAQKLGAFEVPFCSLREQREIVCRVKRLLATAQKTESGYLRARACIEHLTQSILAKTFRGELVPTEAELAELEGRSFESAEELLVRIGKNASTNRRKTRATASTGAAGQPGRLRWRRAAGPRGLAQANRVMLYGKVRLLVRRWSVRRLRHAQTITFSLTKAMTKLQSRHWISVSSVQDAIGCRD